MLMLYKTPADVGRSVLKSRKADGRDQQGPPGAKQTLSLDAPNVPYLHYGSTQGFVDVG